MPDASPRPDAPQRPDAPAADMLPPGAPPPRRKLPEYLRREADEVRARRLRAEMRFLALVAAMISLGCVLLVVLAQLVAAWLR